MSAQRVPVRRIGIGLAVAAALLTSACAAGQHAQTADEKNSIDGTNASVGAVDLRAMVIDAPSGSTFGYPAGSDMVLKIVMVNNADKPEKLTSISSPSFSDWGAFTSPAAADEVIAAHAAAQSPSSAAAAPSSAPASAGSGAPSGSAAAPSQSASSVPAAQLPTPQRSITIAGNGRVGFGTPEATGVLLLIDTKGDISPANSIPVTFTFAQAGAVTVQVPVALSNGMPSSVLPSPSTSGLEG